MILVLGAVIKNDMVRWPLSQYWPKPQGFQCRKMPQEMAPNQDIPMAATHVTLLNILHLPGGVVCPEDFRMTASLMLNI